MKMLFALCTYLCAALMIGCTDEPAGVSSLTGTQGNSGEISSLGTGENGNGFPSGSHYNLNIIGVSNPKTADMTGNSGHRIFVLLTGKSKIKLIEGDDFQVLDANATDDGEAMFQLPNPDPDGDGTSTYSVYARALGKPGGEATITTCATDEFGTEYCSTESELLIRSAGKPMAKDVSRTLLTIYADIGDGLKRYTLFDEALQDYFWEYDNRGLKLAQLRFYEIPANLN